MIVDPMSMLKNPMILIAGVGMLLVFGMPYLMENSTLDGLSFSDYVLPFTLCETC
jgi:hypothetical protein